MPETIPLEDLVAEALDIEHPQAGASGRGRRQRTREILEAAREAGRNEAQPDDLLGIPDLLRPALKHLQEAHGRGKPADVRELRALLPHGLVDAAQAALAPDHEETLDDIMGYGVDTAEDLYSEAAAILRNGIDARLGIGPAFTYSDCQVERLGAVLLESLRRLRKSGG